MGVIYSFFQAARAMLALGFLYWVVIELSPRVLEQQQSGAIAGFVDLVVEAYSFNPVNVSNIEDVAVIGWMLMIIVAGLPWMIADRLIIAISSFFRP